MGISLRPCAWRGLDSFSNQHHSHPSSAMQSSEELHFPECPLPNSPPPPLPGWRLHGGNSGEIWKAERKGNLSFSRGGESQMLHRCERPKLPSKLSRANHLLQAVTPSTSTSTFAAAAPSSLPPLCQQSCKPLKLY